MKKAESFENCLDSLSEETRIKMLKVLNMDKTILKELGFSDQETTLLHGFAEEINSSTILKIQGSPDLRLIKFLDGSEVSFDASNATSVRSN